MIHRYGVLQAASRHWKVAVLDACRRAEPPVPEATYYGWRRGHEPTYEHTVRIIAAMRRVARERIGSDPTQARRIIGLHEQLTLRRIELGLTQPDVDQAGGFTEGQVAKWESGFRNPGLYNLDAWADTLDCDLLLVPRQPADRAAA